MLCRVVRLLNQNASFLEKITYPVSRTAHLLNLTGNSPRRKACLTEQGTYFIKPTAYSNQWVAHSIEQIAYYIKQTAHFIEPIAHSFEQVAHSIEPIVYSFEKTAHFIEPITYSFEKVACFIKQGGYSIGKGVYSIKQGVYSIGKGAYLPKQKGYLFGQRVQTCCFGAVFMYLNLSGWENLTGCRRGGRGFCTGEGFEGFVVCCSWFVVMVVGLFLASGFWLLVPGFGLLPYCRAYGPEVVRGSCLLAPCPLHPARGSLS